MQGPTFFFKIRFIPQTLGILLVQASFTFLAANYTSLPDLQNGNIYNIYNIYTMKAGHFSANKKCFGYLDWIHQTDLILDKMKHISPDLPYLADHTIVEEGDSESYNRFNCFHSANERAG